MACRLCRTLALLMLVLSFALPGTSQNPRGPTPFDVSSADWIKIDGVQRGKAKIAARVLVAAVPPEDTVRIHLERIDNVRVVGIPCEDVSFSPHDLKVGGWWGRKRPVDMNCTVTINEVRYQTLKANVNRKVAIEGTASVRAERGRTGQWTIDYNMIVLAELAIPDAAVQARFDDAADFTRTVTLKGTELRIDRIDSLQINDTNGWRTFMTSEQLARLPPPPDSAPIQVPFWQEDQGRLAKLAALTHFEKNKSQTTRFFCFPLGESTVDLDDSERDEGCVDHPQEIKINITLRGQPYDKAVPFGTEGPKGAGTLPSNQRSLKGHNLPHALLLSNDPDYEDGRWDLRDKPQVTIPLTPRARELILQFQDDSGHPVAEEITGQVTVADQTTPFSSASGQYQATFRVLANDPVTIKASSEHYQVDSRVSYDGSRRPMVVRMAKRPPPSFAKPMFAVLLNPSRRFQHAPPNSLEEIKTQVWRVFAELNQPRWDSSFAYRFFSDLDNEKLMRTLVAVKTIALDLNDPQIREKALRQIEFNSVEVSPLAAIQAYTHLLSDFIYPESSTCRGVLVYVQASATDPLYLGDSVIDELDRELGSQRIRAVIVRLTPGTGKPQVLTQRQHRSLKLLEFYMATASNDYFISAFNTVIGELRRLQEAQ